MKKTASLDYGNKANEKLRYSFLVIGCLTLCVMLTVYAPQSKNSISDSLAVCSKTVIPSLFPFMFLSSFMAESGVFGKSFKLSDKLSRVFFKQPQCALGVFLLSTLGGFPVGGKMTKQLYEKGRLTQNQARRLMLFCVNPGPAFTINILGLSLLGSTKLGLIIYSSIVLSNLIIAFLSRFLADCEEEVSCESERIPLYSAFVRSGSDAASSIIGICTFVLVFSCLAGLIEALISSETVNDVLIGTLEVTTGCERLARFSSAPLLAGVTAWGGISVHCQIADCIKKTGLDLKLFLTARIVSAGLSAVICDLILKLFPTEIPTVAASASITSVMSESSFPISVAMLLTCCVFLIGDYSVNSRRKC